MKSIIQILIYAIEIINPKNLHYKMIRTMIKRSNDDNKDLHIEKEKKMELKESNGNPNLGCKYDQCIRCKNINTRTKGRLLLRLRWLDFRILLGWKL